MSTESQNKIADRVIKRLASFRMKLEAEGGTVPDFLRVLQTPDDLRAYLRQNKWSRQDRAGQYNPVLKRHDSNELWKPLWDPPIGYSPGSMPLYSAVRRQLTIDGYNPGRLY